MNKTTKNLKKSKPFPGVSHKPRKTIIFDIFYKISKIKKLLIRYEE